MHIKRKTKLTQNKTSLSTTLPAPIAELLELKAGDFVEWELNIDNSGKKTLCVKAED